MTAQNANYRIGPRDLLAIKVFEAPELDSEQRVSEDGMLTLPRIGELAVRGLTESQVAARLEEMLEAGPLQRASVSVQVREFRSRPIAVIGAVRSPGNLELPGRWTLLEALAGAGGLAADHGGKIQVVRNADNGLSDQVTVSVEDLFVRADPAFNLPVFAGDMINVPAASEVTIYCLGEVESPGAQTFKSTQRITLLAAISRAGGLSDRASRRIRIRRQGAQDDEIEIDFKRILEGKDPDLELRSGDVVVVKESFF